MIIPAVALFAALGVTADPIDARYAPFLQTGCVDGPPIAAGLHAEESRAEPLPLDDMPMSARSLRFIIAPDGFRGDGLLSVQIDSGLRRSLGAGGRPFLLATVGHARRTCTVRMPLDDCPQAAAVSERLQRLQVPVGHGFEEPDTLSLHTTRYALQFHGEDVNQLSYSTPGNPLEQPLEAARAALKSCWQAAFDAAASR